MYPKVKNYNYIAKCFSDLSQPIPAVTISDVLLPGDSAHRGSFPNCEAQPPVLVQSTSPGYTPTLASLTRRETPGSPNLGTYAAMPGRMSPGARADGYRGMDPLYPPSPCVMRASCVSCGSPRGHRDARPQRTTSLPPPSPRGPSCAACLDTESHHRVPLGG